VNHNPLGHHAGWIVCERNKTFSLQSHPITNHCGYICTTHPHVSSSTCIIPTRVNQPLWLHQLAVLSIGWAGWFVSFSSASLPLTNIVPQSIFFGCWLSTIFFCCHFFPSLDLHTPDPPGYPIELKLSLAYKLTTNPLFTLRKLLSPLD